MLTILNRGQGIRDQDFMIRINRLETKLIEEWGHVGATICDDLLASPPDMQLLLIAAADPLMCCF